jgi:hypothetical protein
MAGDDQLRSGVDQVPQDGPPLGDRPFAASPGRPDEVVMERNDPEGARGRIRQHACGVPQLVASERAALVPPRAHRVEAANHQTLGTVDGLRLGPVAPEFVERVQQPGGRPRRDVVVSRDDHERTLERAEQACRPRLLLGPVAVRKIASCEDDLGISSLHECDEIGLDLRLFARSRMEIGNVQHAEVWHRAGRL